MTTTILDLVDQYTILKKQTDEIENRIRRFRSEAAVFSWRSFAPNTEPYHWLRYDSDDQKVQVAQIVAKDPKAYGITDEKLKEFLGMVLTYRIGRSIGLPVGPVPNGDDWRSSNAVIEEFLVNPSKYLPAMLNDNPQKAQWLLKFAIKDPKYGDLSFRVTKSLFIENSMYSEWELISEMSRNSAIFQEELMNPGSYKIVLTDENLFNVEKVPPYWAVYLFVGVGLGFGTVDLLAKCMKRKHSIVDLDRAEVEVEFEDDSEEELSSGEW